MPPRRRVGGGAEARAGLRAAPPAGTRTRSGCTQRMAMPLTRRLMAPSAAGGPQILAGSQSRRLLP
eukprot:1282802-Alexandrium_andersonii.AAC.1